MEDGITYRELVFICGTLIQIAAQLEDAAQMGDASLLNDRPTAMMSPDGLRDMAAELRRRTARLALLVPRVEVGQIIPEEQVGDGEGG